MSGKGNSKKTQIQFEKEVYDLYQTEYTVLGQYVNANEFIKMRHNCEKCNNHEYDVKPTQFLKGRYKCSICFRTNRKNTDKFKKEVYDKYGTEYEVVGEYTRSNEYIQIRHICGKEYPVLPNAFLQGNSCPACGSALRVLNKTKTHDEFVEEVYNLEGENYIVMSQYSGCKNEIDLHHVQCNFTYTTTPTNFLQNHRCPKCNQSKMEIIAHNYFEINNYYFIPQKTFDGLLGVRNGNLSYDFYLPNYNLLVEMQGEQHERFIKGMHLTIEDFERQVEHDRRKKEYAIDNNYNLLEIWYYDFDNIEKILTSKLQELSNQDSSFLIAK